MSSAIGNKIKVQIFGQSHSEALGVVIDGLPAGEEIDLNEVNEFLRLRAPGRNKYSTQRREGDLPKILSGMKDNRTCGAPLCAVFENKDAKSADYDAFSEIPRPSHADYTAYVKHNGYNDAAGGGHFSGRLTLPMCFAGAVCIQILRRAGITVNAHIYSIGDIFDASLDANGKLCEFPVFNAEAGERMKGVIEEAASEGDSVGGVIECVVWGFPAGFGEPMFDNVESRLSYGLFGIPAVKGVEFGAGFAGANMRGSQYNDNFCIEGGIIKTETNNSGGVLGGITNGMPITFKVAVKPTPSIFKPQRSVNMKTVEETELIIKGRHDPCVVPRAVPCVMAVAAIIMYDIYLEGK